MSDRLRWEVPAALSAANFTDRYVKYCCSHTEAVSECPHCNLQFLADWVRRAAAELVSKATRAGS